MNKEMAKGFWSPWFVAWLILAELFFLSVATVHGADITATSTCSSDTISLNYRIPSASRNPSNTGAASGKDVQIYASDSCGTPIPLTVDLLVNGQLRKDIDLPKTISSSKAGGVHVEISSKWAEANQKQLGSAAIDIPFN